MDEKLPVKVYLYSTYENVQRGIKTFADIGSDYFIKKAVYDMNEVEVLTDVSNDHPLAWNAIKILPEAKPYENSLREFIENYDWKKHYQRSTIASKFLTIPSIEQVFVDYGFTIPLKSMFR